MFKNSNLKTKILFPIVISTLIIILTLSIVLYKVEKNVLSESGVQMASLVTKQSSEMRKIYAGKIMPKIFENGGYDDADKQVQDRESGDNDKGHKEHPCHRVHFHDGAHDAHRPTFQCHDLKERE